MVPGKIWLAPVGYKTVCSYTFALYHGKSFTVNTLTRGAPEWNRADPIERHPSPRALVSLSTRYKNLPRRMFGCLKSTPRAEDDH